MLGDVLCPGCGALSSWQRNLEPCPLGNKELLRELKRRLFREDQPTYLVGYPTIKIVVMKLIQLIFEQRGVRGADPRTVRSPCISFDSPKI